METLVELAAYAARLTARLDRITADPAAPTDLLAGTVTLRQAVCCRWKPSNWRSPPTETAAPSRTTSSLRP
ncbi:hypothetical protein [Streptomyces sp. NPDC002690]